MKAERAVPHVGAPLSFCLRVWKRGGVSCPFGGGFNRSLQSVHAWWYGGLSDYGRCVFGSGTNR